MNKIGISLSSSCLIVTSGQASDYDELMHVVANLYAEMIGGLDSVEQFNHSLNRMSNRSFKREFAGLLGVISSCL